MPNSQSAIPKSDAIPVRERTYEFLKTNLLSGRFSPGDRLVEEQLAGELGVSRTPIREALHKLELEGLVEPIGTRGFRVPRDSLEEIDELFELRTVLEGYTMRIVCEVISDETMERLKEFIRNAEDALIRKKVDEVFKWNTHFHDTIHDLVSHRRRLHALLVNMRKYVLRYRKDTLNYLEGSRRSIDGHKKILLALSLKDADLCERVMRQHVAEAREDTLQGVSGLSGLDSIDLNKRKKRAGRRVAKKQLTTR